MAGSLNSAELTEYQERGILFPLPVMSGDEAARYLEAANVLEEALGGNCKPVELSQMHLYYQWAYELITHPAILDAVESILGEDLIVWSAGLFPKHPGQGTIVGWHQDGTYWNLDSQQVVTAWLALSESNAANGCMRVIPGTQEWSIQPHRDTYSETNVLSRGQEVETEFPEDDALDVVLSPGQISLHHVNLVHGSGPNTSQQQRTGYAIRYISPQVKQTGNEAPTGVLVRGKDRYGNYQLAGPLESLSPEESLTRMQDAARAQLAAVMENTDAARNDQ